MMKIGFIGLGIMGKPMCHNLLRAGYAVTAYDRHKENIDAVVEAGAVGAGSVAEVARTSEVIITMVQNSPNVRDIALGEEGIIAHARPGTLVVDMSSIDPLESQAIGAALSEKGIAMIDAPVSGGEPKAISGELSVMVGGAQEEVDRVQAVLGAMATSVVRVGELGAGNVAKLANQVIVAVNIAAVSEALTLAKKAGTDPQKVFEAIRGGLAGSSVLDAKAPMMLAHDFTPGFRIELHIKDLGNAMTTAAATETTLPLAEKTLAMMRTLQLQGHGKDDHSGLVQYYETFSHTSLAANADQAAEDAPKLPLVLYYAKCSTCQKALKWLDDHGIAYEGRPIREENPSAEELGAWQAASGLALKRFFNTSGQLYKSLGLKDKLAHMSEEEQLALLATDGMLVKRPLLVSDAVVCPGFKEEEWQKLL